MGKESAFPICSDLDLVAQLRRLFPNGHPDFIPLCIQEMALHAVKNRDYTGGEGHDPLGNFRRVASILGHYPNLDIANPVVVALTYAMKQLDAALWMLSEDYDGKIEGIQERLGDVSVYAKLARLLVED